MLSLVAHFKTLGDLGDFEPREHGMDYLDGMVFAPNQVINKFLVILLLKIQLIYMSLLIDSCWYCIDSRIVGQNQGTT